MTDINLIASGLHVETPCMASDDEISLVIETPCMASDNEIRNFITLVIETPCMASLQYNKSNDRK